MGQNVIHCACQTRPQQIRVALISVELVVRVTRVTDMDLVRRVGVAIVTTDTLRLEQANNVCFNVLMLVLSVRSDRANASPLEDNYSVYVKRIGLAETVISLVFVQVEMSYRVLVMARVVTILGALSAVLAVYIGQARFASSGAPEMHRTQQVVLGMAAASLEMRLLCVNVSTGGQETTVPVLNSTRVLATEHATKMQVVSVLITHLAQQKCIFQERIVNDVWRIGSVPIVSCSAILQKHMSQIQTRMGIELAAMGMALVSSKHN